MITEAKKSYMKQYRETNREKIKNQSKIKRSTPEWKQRRKQHRKTYKERHKETIRKQQKRYRQKNREKCVAATKRWILKHPERNKAFKKKYQDKHKAEAALKLKSRRALIKGCTVDERGVNKFYQNARNKQWVSCYWCQTLVRGQDCHIDHIVPLAKGGRHAIDNLCTSCCVCNRSKSSKLPHEWRTLPQLFLTI